MEQDQRVCPRCGKPAGEYRFCQSCRSHIDSLLGTSSRAGAGATAPSQPATQVLREVARLEQALAAVSKGINDRIAAGASLTGLQVDATVGASESSTDEARRVMLDTAKLATSADQQGGDASQPPREVARLEDVLTLRPTNRAAASPERPGAPELEPAQQAPAAEATAPPGEATARPGDATAPPGEERAQKISPPAYVAADALRDAFWFEVAAAAAPKPEAIAEAAPMDAPAVEVTVGEPAIEALPPVEPELSEAASYYPEPELPEARRSRSHWLLALCLLALAGLAVALTGRARRGD